jgi:hypothetical protein
MPRVPQGAGRGSSPAEANMKLFWGSYGNDASAQGVINTVSGLA